MINEIFKLTEEYQSDPRKEKINGTVGIYLDDNNHSYVHPVVKRVIRKLDLNNFNYLPISGDQIFLDEAARLFLKDDLFTINSPSMNKQGVIGGTNGLFVWANLFATLKKHPKLIMGEPTWENHKNLFSYTKFQIVSYPQVKNNCFNLDQCISTIRKHPDSFILFQGGSTHNPTGINPNLEQWQVILKQIKLAKHHVLFDFAYMVLVENIEKDSQPIRLFIKNKIPCSVVVSFSKNMCLYQHRVGALFVFSYSQKKRKKYQEVIQNHFRLSNSNPAAFGELIVKTILANNALKNEWLNSLEKEVKSLNDRRELFIKLTSPKFEFIKKQKGLFGLLKLNQHKIYKLRKNYGIYLLSNGRINFGGIPITKVKYLAEAILKTDNQS